MATKEFHSYGADGRYISTLYLEEDEAPKYTGITDISPDLVPDTVPYFIDGKWENREYAVPDLINPEIEPRRVYPPIEEQLDMLWHAMEAGQIPKAEQFFDTIKMVKESAPAPTPTETIFDVGTMPGA